MKKHLKNTTRIDHLAIAVDDLDEALFLYQGVLGFELLKKREIKGEFSGMLSAELCGNGFTIVLLQGTSPESQISKYIERFGSGVQHVAIEVDDIESIVERLGRGGMEFSTNIIKGENLNQIFTKRDMNSGMMFEFIQKKSMSNQGFEVGNIESLFSQLELNSSY